MVPPLAVSASPPPVTGTISGRVTVGGTGISSVTVTLSNGSATTTGASGNYSFSGVPVGSYTVTIRNVSSEVTCGTTSLSVTISSSALQATAHFTCVPAANASISGAVTAEGFSVPNVEVVLSGPSPATAMTDANGQFSFTSLLAGAYTVMISGFSEGLYLFTTTSQSVTLAAGQSATVNFEGLTCLVGSISMNQTVDGTLASGNCSLTSGEFVDVWSFSLGSSTAVQINLTSSEFDAFLILTDDMIVTLDSDDDGGGGVNSQINITLEAGDYLIWATSFDPGESESYQLSLEASVPIVGTVSGRVSVEGTGLPGVTVKRSPRTSAVTTSARRASGVASRPEPPGSWRR